MRLTDGEKFYIYRRRVGWSQVEAARRFGTGTADAYRALESGQWRVGWRKVPVVQAVTALEKCVLMRRRAGMTQRALAEAIGRSRCWVNQAERGLVNGKRLKQYWEL